jgi:prolyl oligopeptidase
MFKRSLFLLAAVSLFVGSIPAQRGFDYPKARKADQVDDYHGTKVADPYRWMEDTNSVETQKWIEEQVAFTQAYLDTIPERSQIRERLTEIWNYERVSAPSKVTDGFYIYSRNDGLQNQSVLYRASSIKDEGKVFFDPNKLSTDGTVSLSGSSFTDDGKL